MLTAKNKYTAAYEGDGTIIDRPKSRTTGSSPVGEELGGQTEQSAGHKNI